MTERVRGLDLAPGSALGKYEVVRKLATGGMAEIYLARRQGTAGFQKIVVLKRILPHIAQDPQFVQMFLDEARLTATLQHPNIADVYDVGEYDQGEVFYTMEYVQGQDVRGLRWAARKRDEQLPLAISLAIIHGTASALDYAHAKRGLDGTELGLVHRDISSSNIMISYDGAVKLLDFGIARATNQRQKTQTGTLKGKIPYMSPEQCRSSHLDRRSDLFSLGTVMFEITTGRRPFRGQGDFDVMEQIVHGNAPRPSTIVSGYPLDLEAIVMKALARDREERYQSAEEMLHDLDAFLATHKLWASTKVIGRYMRGLFSDRITAWETAMQQGQVPESLTPVTSGGSRAELHTPSAAFEAVRLSQEQLIAEPTDEELEQINDKTVAMPNAMLPHGGTAPISAIIPTVEPDPSSISRVSQIMPMTPAPRRHILWIAGGGVAVGVMAILVVMLISRRGADAGPDAEPNTKVQLSATSKIELPTDVKSATTPRPVVGENQPTPSTSAKPEPVAIPPTVETKRTIVVESVPSGAQVFVGTERKARGMTPYTFELEAPVSIRVVRGGFRVEQRQITLEETKVAIRLVPLPRQVEGGGGIDDNTMNPFGKR